MMMMKKYCLISNITLLLWYFLAMTGVYFEDKYLVTTSYKEEWIFMLIPLIAFIFFIFKENIGRYILTTWLSIWFITQFFKP